MFRENATVVVVHGAWADGSSWNAVILPLEKEGLRVIAAPIPLTSLGDDVAAVHLRARAARLCWRGMPMEAPSSLRRMTSA